MFEGESDKLLAAVRLKLKPKEMRFYRLERIKRVDGRAGIIVVDSEKELTCEGHLANLQDPKKVIDYRLIRVDTYPGCC